MKPYYEHAGITIYHGDCRETLPHVTADVVVTDPPYDCKTHDGADPAFSKIDFEPLTNPSRLACDLVQTAQRWVVCFCSVEQIAAYRDGAGTAWVRAGVWDRISNMPQMSGDRPAQGVEGVAIMHREGRKRWNGGGKAAIWRHLVERGEKAHPTQKPLSLIREIVELFSDEGEVVLDPFMGSGTTLVAAKQLGRRAIGIEIEERYCEIAAKRLAQEVFDFGPTPHEPQQETLVLP